MNIGKIPFLGDFGAIKEGTASFGFGRGLGNNEFEAHHNVGD